MPDSLNELERLAALRESGALTDVEFELQKRRLLSAPTPAAPSPTRRSDILIWSGIGGAGLVLGLVLGFGLARLPGGHPATAVPPAAAAPIAAAPDVRSLPASAQLQEAFKVAFGGPPPVNLTTGRNGEATDFTPGRLLWTASGAILISEGKVPNPAHVSSGKLAVHYLKPDGMSFTVARRFVPVLESGSFGQMSEWGVNSKFGARPVIYAEGGGTWQGYTCSWTTLTELGENGPVELVTIPTTYDNLGAMTGDEAADGSKSLGGKITNVVAGTSFDVAYTGTDRFIDHYVRRGARYVLDGGPSRMLTC